MCFLVSELGKKYVPHPSVGLFTCRIEKDRDRVALWVNKKQESFSTAHIELWSGCPADGRRSQPGSGALVEFGLCKHV